MKHIYLILVIALLWSCSESKKAVDQNSVESSQVTEAEVAGSKSKKEEPNLPKWLGYVANATYASLDKLAPGSEKAQQEQKAAVSKDLPLEVKLKKSGIAFRLVPAGEFIMGSEKGKGLETYVHSVKLTKNFYCGKFEVTQAQWQKVMGGLPARYKELGLQKSDQFPMLEVSWDDCQAFMRELEKFEGMPENSLDLLTEAQWEYACRAGTKTEFYFGEKITSDYVNYDGQYPFEGSPKSLFRNKLLDVGSLPGNAFGTHDMHGNVGEWCADIVDTSRARAITYEDGIIDPISKEGDSRVIRNGSYGDSGISIRSSRRLGAKPTKTYSSVGFRIKLKVSALSK